MSNREEFERLTKIKNPGDDFSWSELLEEYTAYGTQRRWELYKMQQSENTKLRDERDEILKALIDTNLLLGKKPLTEETGKQWIKNESILSKYAVKKEPQS